MFGSVRETARATQATCAMACAVSKDRAFMLLMTLKYNFGYKNTRIKKARIKRFFFSFSGWGETESTWYVGHCWPIVPAPDDR
jgi:hypothetical protein